MTSMHDPSKVNIKELFPAHSRKIDILEQRIAGPSTLSNDASESEKLEEEVLDSDEDEQLVTPLNNSKMLLDETPKASKAATTTGNGTVGLGPRDATLSPSFPSSLSSSSHKYGRFSLEEDRKIIEGYNKFGNKWDEIIRWGNLGRTSSQISSRFTRKLCKSPSSSSSSSSVLPAGTIRDRDDADKSTIMTISPLPLNRTSEADDQPPAKQRRVDTGAREAGAGAGAGAGLSGCAGVGAGASGKADASTLSMGYNTAATALIDATTASIAAGDDVVPTPAIINSSSPSSLRNGFPQTMEVAGAATKLSTNSNDGSIIETDLWKDERDRISGTERALRERESRLAEWESRLKEWEWRLQQKVGDEHKRTTDFLCEQLVGRARAERALARKKLAEDCVRFGQSSYERRGLEMVEMWQDGEVFQQLDEQLKALTKTRESLEAKKKQLAKSRQSTSKTATATAVAVSDGASEEEILKVRIMALKREEAALQEERDRHHAPKLLHMKEMKRAADEDQSLLSDFRRLHDHRYLLLSLLGKGGFSEVYLAFDLKELRQVACKIHSVNSMWSITKRQNYTKHAIREYKIHKELVHDRVVRLYDVFEIDSSSFCTVLEYCEAGDLDSYLKQNKMLSEREAKCIIAQIFSGLKYLNSQKRPIIHYDLKPGNILFHHNGEVKITDFGLSKIMEEDSEFVELTSQGAGTYWYLPPECFEMGGKQPPMISSKVDVWSVGVIFYQLLYGKKPFGNDMSQQRFLSENVAAQTIRVDFPSKPVVSKEAKDFLQKCLTHNQLLRPDVQSCCSDPFLTSARTGGKKTAPVSPALHSNPQMPPPPKSNNIKRKIDSE